MPTQKEMIRYLYKKALEEELRKCRQNSVEVINSRIFALATKEEKVTYYKKLQAEERRIKLKLDALKEES